MYGGISDHELNTSISRRQILRQQRNATAHHQNLEARLQKMHIDGTVNDSVKDWLLDNPPLVRTSLYGGVNDGSYLRAGSNICSHTGSIGHVRKIHGGIPGQTLHELRLEKCPALNSNNPLEVVRLLDNEECRVIQTDSEACPLFLTKKETTRGNFINFTDEKNLNYNRTFNNSAIDDLIYPSIGY